MIPLTLDFIKTLAQRMNFVSFDTLELENQSVRSHWYRHDDGLDFYYFQKDDGRLIKLHISVLGQVIEWNPLDGTRTGLLVEHEQGGEVFESIHYDSRANHASLEQGVVVIENANGLASPLREELLRVLQHSESIKKEPQGLFARLFSRWRKA